MTEIIVKLDDEKAQELSKEAIKLGVSIEDAARRGIHEFLERKRTIRDSANRVLNENAELYRRLA